MDFCGFGGFFCSLLMQEETHPAREHLQENPPLMAKSCSAHVIVIPSGKGGIGIKGQLKSDSQRLLLRGGEELQIQWIGRTAFIKGWYLGLERLFLKWKKSSCSCWW